MSTTFRPYDPNQLLLLPPSLKEWVPEGHLANFISDTVDELDLRKLYERYEGDGRRASPYEPLMMLKVLLYAYSSGVFSSRRISRRIEDEIAFRYLAAGNFPNFRTINRFRQENIEHFQNIFVQVVRLAKEVGLVRMGTLAVDGSKINANASKHKAMSYRRMKEEEDRLQKEIAGLLAHADATDAEEDRLYGEDKRGDELPDELARRESRLHKIREAKQRLEQRQRKEDEERGRHDDGDDDAAGAGLRSGSVKSKRRFGVPPDKAQENFSDPESRIMKTSRNGFQQCYNAQIAVDSAHQIIVANSLDNKQADNACLIPMISQARKNTRKSPVIVLADAGYRSEENFKALKRTNVFGLIALAREGKNGITKISKDLKLTRQMFRRLKSKSGAKLYRRRKAIAEPPFGWIKRVLGFVSFSLRSKWKCSGEWSLVCSALNLRRLANLMEWQTA